MTLLISDQPKKRRGRRRNNRPGHRLSVSLQSDDLELIDTWIASHAPGESRAGAMRRLLWLAVGAGMIGQAENMAGVGDTALLAVAEARGDLVDTHAASDPRDTPTDLALERTGYKKPA